MNRTWTLQENILPQDACLYVTDHRVYYSRHENLCAEDRSSVAAEEMSRPVSSIGPQTLWLRYSSRNLPARVGEDWTHHLYTYARLCTRLHLQDAVRPSDVLHATLRPLIALSLYLGQRSLPSLPNSYCNHALPWASTMKE